MMSNGDSETVSGATRPALRVPLNDLRRAYREQQDELRDAALRVLGTGSYILGEEVSRFEQELADAVGVAHAIGVASGTDALTLILTALRPRVVGSAVATVANAGGYTTVAARRSGLRPVYVDIDARTHCMDPGDLAMRLAREGDVGIVVVTHLYGRLADLEDISDVCRSAGAILVEDCAQAIGAVRSGRHAGSTGAASAFSFYPTKNLGALGDGGAVTTDDPLLAEDLRRLRQYGWSTKYVVAALGGLNSRLDDLQAAFLRVRLPMVDDWNSRRRGIISRYRASVVEDRADLAVLPADRTDHAGHLAVAVADDRERLRRRLAAAGIASDVHYPVPDHRQAIGGTSVALPITEHLAGRILTLPCFPQMTEAEIERVCHVLASE